MSVESQKETLQYQAEVSQLLDLVANSLYSDSEVFLRELISNASDATDKLQYEALNNNALYEGDAELKIWVSVDAKKKTVTVRDNGIGMDRSDVIEHLGTIAKSGTKAFKDLLESKKDNDKLLIGQFGVGFYSSFVVADKVTVRTRKAGTQSNEGVEWVSDGKGEYSVENIESPNRGTEVVLHLKKSQHEYLETVRLENIIKKYSDHILLPIMLEKTKEEGEGDDKKSVTEFEKVNDASALWTLPKSDISDEQYNAFYKQVSHDFEDPLAHIHSKVEGKSDYTMLLYLPKRAPFDLWNREHQRGLKLYVRRVFIMDDAEHFLPLYLRFVKGVIDSSDLPLNISREILQSNPQIDRMRSGVVKKVLGLLDTMAKKDQEKYQEFWKEFGQVLKEGVVEDFSNKDKVANLFRFASTHSDEETQNVSLQDYVSRMKDGQDKIYYVIADSFNAAKNSPLLEVFRKKGVEVLLMSDRVDEWMVGHLTEFEGKQLQSIGQGELDDIGTEEEKKQAKEEKAKEEKAFESVLKQVADNLKDKVKEVRITERLVDSPSCVVFGDGEMSGHLQRIMAAAGQAMPTTLPILELNPKHRLVLKLKDEQDDERFKGLASVLFGQALLAEGETLDNPAEFVKELNQLL